MEKLNIGYDVKSENHDNISDLKSICFKNI